MFCSIITVNLNNADGLQKTIESVITQNYPNINHIIIDGGSTDNSISVIKKYESKLTYWCSEKDNGVYHAMNKGISLANNSKYYLFLNSGDYLADSNIILKTERKIASLAIQNEDNTIFYGDLIVDNTIIPHRDKVDLQLLAYSSIPHPAAFIPTLLFKKLGFYDEKYAIISDWIFFFKAYLAQISFIHIDLAVSVFELNGLSSNSEKIKAEKKAFLTQEYPNFVHEFERIDKIRFYQTSRLHRIVESIRKYIH